MYNYKKHAYFHLARSGRIEPDESCINARLYRFSKEQNVLPYDGFIRIGTHADIRYGVAIATCHIDPGVVYNNTIWFNLDDEVYANMSRLDLRDLAINIFISKEFEYIDEYNKLIERSNERIETLKKLSKEVKKWEEE